MFDITQWFLARIRWSEYYRRPYYTTTLTQAVENDLGERMVLSDPSYQRSDDTPVGRVYFGDSLDEYENGDKFCYINLDENWDKSRIMTEEQFQKAKLAVAKQDSVQDTASA